MRRSAVLVLTLLLCLAPPHGSQAGTPVQISRDTFTNLDAQHATQVEPDTFSFGSTVVAAFQNGRYVNGGAAGIGFATSTDGGLSWTSGFLPGLTVHSDPPGPYARASDPSVAYDAAHDVWLITTLGLKQATLGSTQAVPQVGGAAVLVSRSTDGGLTWDLPVVVSSAAGTSDYDKTWMACDNWPSSLNRGRCYAAWDDFGLGDRLLMSTSSDGGQTWGPKKPAGLGSTGLGGIPLPRPDGTVIVPASSPSGARIIAFRSLNGGQTWTSAVPVGSVTAHTVAGNLRVAASLPSADVDASGRAYVVWADCRFRVGCASNDLVLTTSDDGVRWTPVVRIPIDATTSTVDHFLPGLAVDHATSGGTAQLALTYYYYPTANCTEATCQLSVGFVSSPDGGATWSFPRTLAGPISPAWLANTTQGRMVGDYISTSLVDGGQAVPVFALADAPVRGVYDEAMFADIVAPAPPDATHPLRVDASEPIRSTQSDRPTPQQPLKIR